MRRLKEKELLEQQVRVFMEWGTRHGIVTSEYVRWLELFIAVTHKTDILDVTDDDLDFFMSQVYNTENSQHSRSNARKAVQAIRRYYGARSKNAKKRDTMGRPAHIGEIRKAQNYRKMGLNLSEIGKLMGRYKSQIHRWVHYSLDSQKED